MLQLIPGGFLKAVVDDTAPVLGGNLDGGGHNISNVAAGTFVSLVADSLVVDSPTLFVDKVNHLVGIGTLTPGQLLHLASTSPRMIWDDTNAPVDNKKVGMSVSLGDFYFFAYNDAEDASVNFMEGYRTGLVINAVSFPHGNIGIGLSAPATSAKVDITSTTGALLVSRMTTAQRNALTAVNGMILYDSTENKFKGRENGAWVNLI